MTADAAALARGLLEWYRSGHRELPWRGTGDPYRVWVAEVMLQQTRVAVVAARYGPFLERYPTVEALASATEQDVLASWAGLGYYRRARMLHAAARQIVGEHGGRLPAEPRLLRGLPGVGEYTAAAIASIAFDRPTAALDGNALRALARLADERRPPKGRESRNALRSLATSLVAAVPTGSRGDFTQALIELGATVCVSGTPRCEQCPWRASCAALAAGSAGFVPATSPRPAPRRSQISAGLVVSGGRILLRQRPAAASIMPGFWELPQARGDPCDLARGGLAIPETDAPLATFRHAITSSLFTVRVYAASPGPATAPRAKWASPSEARNLPLTTITAKALRKCLGWAAPGVARPAGLSPG